VEKRPYALVVGASRGIGKAISLRLADSGFDIGATYRSNHAEAEKTKAEIEAKGVACELFAFDVSDHASTSDILEKRFDERAPDVLVYNAGIARDNLFAMMSKDEWDSVIDTNLGGFYNVVKPIVFAMLRAKKGRIVIISSTSGQIGQAGQVNYSASKAGLIGAAKALAREVAKKNVLVNVVAPGVIETEMTDALPKERIMPLIPMGRFGKSEEVASVVNFLAAEPHMYITGQVIGVNGGLAIV